MGYEDAPWIFKGRALYQLHLVKVADAKKYIPENFHIVSLFGYTLGGFYLARYSDSPVGKFDELVALAGLVWNPPTSCAWAARVYVSNWQARNHGRRHCGLPSRMAAFEEKTEVIEKGPPSWWTQQQRGKGALDEARSHPVLLHNEERRSWLQPWKAPAQGLRTPVCSMALPPARRKGWPGPRIRLSLPSFSGGTHECPDLLQYTCQLVTNVRAVTPAQVQACSGQEDNPQEALPSIFRGRPVLALAFDDMEMVVNAPKVLALPHRKGANVQPVMA
ncbi:Protein NEOXANTHIN-DEFICIENT 1 [Coccomyxa sp. Obi]|nr:Protein NEOXANTHIN-DEFICIENT 1 [Coccomyxa sp. Obi]